MTKYGTEIQHALVVEWSIFGELEEVERGVSGMAEAYREGARLKAQYGEPDNTRADRQHIVRFRYERRVIEYEPDEQIHLPGQGSIGR